MSATWHRLRQNVLRSQPAIPASALPDDGAGAALHRCQRSPACGHRRCAVGPSLALDAQIARKLMRAAWRRPTGSGAVCFLHATLHPSAPSEHNFTAGVDQPAFVFCCGRLRGEERLGAAASVASAAPSARAGDRWPAGGGRALRAETALRHMRFHAGTLLPLRSDRCGAAQAGYQSGRATSLLFRDGASLGEHQLEFERRAELGQRLAELEGRVPGFCS